MPSSIGLGVELNSDGNVKMAGGFLLQSLPPGDETKIDVLTKRIQALPPTTTLLQQGLSPTDILGRIFGSDEFQVQQKVPLQFYCPCSQEQIETMLIGLGKVELSEMLASTDPVEVVCEYCRSCYRFNDAQMETLIAAT